ncbi:MULTISPECIES: SDR family NAD(P)-dependent oxidoreductase [unclassified Minwuia]|jgi:NAD(P)-dependent dehydrogenase (short-subunit alcohol dehydrogenase family)|uniref:SDR family NAD(P)-dependent oxidoreductase n=1 Tax=unclassified Minwuia TaxID=2618799 RepID=UPI00247A7B60|nr:MULTISPECIES: SDR family NAD(P)-dependent oxidoreductase [unclassified Minwuia]
MDRGSIFEPGKVAVVTGAALGIGKALALRLAGKGMSVVMADLPGPDLDAALAEVRAAATAGPETVLGHATDVSKPDQIESLKKATLAAFGQVDLLVNNAVTRTGRGFDADPESWRQAMEVNLWGPVTAVQAFLPDLLANPAPTAIVNTGSKQGITNPPGHPIYNMTKSALKTYTEALEHDLRNRPDNQGAARLSAHLLVPGWTTTGKAEHKPGAWLPDRVVDMLLDGVAGAQFYIICPDDEVTAEMDARRILWAAQDITENRPPLSRWHPDFAEVARKACS